jgi:phosphate transport system substrate-binding protein
MKSIKLVAMTAIIGSLLVTATGCGNATNETTKAKQGAQQQLEGEVKIDGSTTVRPIMEAVTEEYRNEQPKVRAGVGGAGTGSGIKKLISGEVDIANASRAMKEEEKKTAAEKKVDVAEYKVAFDGITIITNKENDWVKDLKVEDLKKLWLEDGTTKKWSDINPEWPNREVKFYSPTNSHGTYDYFDEVILEKKDLVTKNVSKSDDPNAIVTGVAGDKDAIGFLGYSYYFENKDKLNALTIDGIEPTKETIESGDYKPLSRPLYIYVNKEALKNKPEVQSYVQFTLENAGELAQEVGYIQLPQVDYDKQLQDLEGLK